MRYMDFALEKKFPLWNSWKKKLQFFSITLVFLQDSGIDAVSRKYIFSQARTE